VKATTATLAGSVLGSFLASVCCIVPLAFAVLGVCGAGYALRLEPFRPFLLLLTYGLLGAAFYLTYRPMKAACDSCEDSGAKRAARAGLWIAAAVVVLTSAFPLYSAYLF
jgi:hypothetical protein